MINIAIPSYGRPHNLEVLKMIPPSYYEHVHVFVRPEEYMRSTV
jgi:hypothetical protein